MIKLTLPIYFKTSANKTRFTLLGMNWYRNAHYFEQNDIKKRYAEIIKMQTVGCDTIEDSYFMHIGIYYSDTSCDGSNISSIIEKFALDALQKNKKLLGDSVKHHISTSWEAIGPDKLNPRAEVEVYVPQGGGMPSRYKVETHLPEDLAELFQKTRQATLEEMLSLEKAASKL